jgi:uncharacterized membrane protein
MPSASGRRNLGALILLSFAMLLGVGFLVGFAFPYLTVNQEQYGWYWPRRGWLLAHIAGGTVALLTGPFLLWMGLNRKRLPLHRTLGKVYMGTIVFSSMAAFYLAFRTDGGWVFGTGLTGLAIAWLTTTGMAYAAIRRRLIEQHQEWMIRSYVVTFGFVFFRIFAGIAEAAGVGTVLERIGAASWFCWALPLLVTEAILQGRKVFAPRRAARSA